MESFLEFSHRPKKKSFESLSLFDTDFQAYSARNVCTELKCFLSLFQISCCEEKFSPQNASFAWWWQKKFVVQPYK